MTKHVLIIGGATFIGNNMAAALLAQGAEVTLFIREEDADNLNPIAQRCRVIEGDVWNPASLYGRGRGHEVVINTIGSMVADPQKGLTHHRLNVVSARNVTQMCVSDGVKHLIFLSVSNAPWLNGAYINAKRDAEAYIARSGIRHYSIIRAPVVYARGARRSLFYQTISALSLIPFLFRSNAPLPVDVLARATARIALQDWQQPLYEAPQLRRLNRQVQQEGGSPQAQLFNLPEPDAYPIEMLDEDAPFGWTPGEPNR